MTANQAEPIESDNDSGIEDSGSETYSARCSLYIEAQEHGRGYHHYPLERQYLFPQDEREQFRLDFQHDIFQLLFNGRLYQSPIQDPQNVLELGCGTGKWLIQFADEHLSSAVRGVDISPIQPTLVPPNSSFEIDDYSRIWNFRTEFDFISMRLPCGSITDLTALLDQVYKNLKPGGWFEVQDACPPTCDDGTIPVDSDLKKWVDEWCEALKLLGRDAFLIEKFGERMRAAGFAQIQSKEFMLPLSPWPEDAQLKEIGKLNMYNVLQGLPGWSFRPFINGLGYSREEVEVLLSGVRKNIREKRIHAYCPV